MSARGRRTSASSESCLSTLSADGKKLVSLSLARHHHPLGWMHSIKRSRSSKELTIHLSGEDGKMKFCMETEGVNWFLLNCGRYGRHTNEPYAPHFKSHYKVHKNKERGTTTKSFS